MIVTLTFRCPNCGEPLPEPDRAFASPLDGSVRALGDGPLAKQANCLVFRHAPCGLIATVGGPDHLTSLAAVGTWAHLMRTSAEVEAGFLFRAPSRPVNGSGGQF